MTRDERNRDLVGAWRAGDPDALADLIRLNRGLIERVAWHLCRLTWLRDRDEVLAEGAIGIWQAATDFDLGGESKFGTFATRKIRGRISNMTPVGLAVWVPKAYRGRPRPWMRPETAAAAHRALRPAVTIARGRERDYNRANRGYEPAVAPEPAGRAEAVAALTLLLDRLPARERTIIERRFGLTAGASGLREIGEDLGISKERVRQICVAALSRLRKATGVGS